MDAGAKCIPIFVPLSSNSVPFSSIPCAGIDRRSEVRVSGLNSAILGLFAGFLSVQSKILAVENMMLQIRLLGQFDIRLAGRRILVPSRAGQSLLAYLALTAGITHRREKLAGILWGIRKAFSAQQSTPIDYLLTDEFTIAFNRDLVSPIRVQPTPRSDWSNPGDYHLAAVRRSSPSRKLKK